MSRVDDVPAAAAVRVATGAGRRALRAPRLGRAASAAGLAGLVAGLAVADRVPGAVGSAVAQTWPPFALVAGLLLVGRAAARDRVFEAAGSRLAALPGGPAVLLGGLLGLVACVTVVLNLDTGVVFLTPLLIEAARARAVDERPFAYGTVLMSNAASLLLPGSNLTNLLIAGDAHVPGSTFAARMLLPWTAAVVVTFAAVWGAHRGGLRRTAPGVGTRPRVRLAGMTGVAAVALAAAAVLALSDPALPVLGLGLAVTLVRAPLRRVPAVLGAATHAGTLSLLLLLAVAVGTAGRLAGLPAGLLDGGWRSVAAGAVAAVAINNLPAAALLGSHPAAHPLHLLVGLDLGPNLCVTASLSAILWMRIARRHGAPVSALGYTRLGIVVVPLSLAAATLCLAVGPAHL